MESFGCMKWEHVCVTKDRLQIMDRDNGGTGIKDTTDERNSKLVQLKSDSAPEQVKTLSKAGAKGQSNGSTKGNADRWRRLWECQHLRNGTTERMGSGRKREETGEIFKRICQNWKKNNLH